MLSERVCWEIERRKERGERLENYKYTGLGLFEKDLRGEFQCLCGRNKGCYLPAQGNKGGEE